MTASVVIDVAGLSKDRVSSFLRKRQRVVDNLSVKVTEGETYGLLGPNGAGKTTTIKLLLGLLRPDAGEARILGERAGDRLALKSIGFLPEHPYFYSHLTAREFLDFIGRLYGMSEKERSQRGRMLIEKVNLSHAADEQTGKYSKGMLQRLGIAQSLINDPRIVFWDEPMSGLDPIGRADVRNILYDLKNEGKTIFLNSHLLPDVNEVCDRVGIMHRGKLIVEENINEIAGSGDYRDLEEYFLEKIEEHEGRVNE